jgi:transcriptional antiterminator RfaH
LGDDEIHVINHEFEPGEKTSIESGPFKGLSAIISRVMPAKERVCVLLELLGGKIEAEVKESVLAIPKYRPTQKNKT